MEVEEAGTAKAPDAVDGDEEIDELSASFALIEASLQDQVHRFPFCYIIHIYLSKHSNFLLLFISHN